MSLGVSAPANADAPITAGAVMKDMPVPQRTAYVRGLIDGIAYARFRKDTLVSGSNDERGMACILNWFSKDALGGLLRIEATFDKYPEEYPPILLTLMVKKECGE